MPDHVFACSARSLSPEFDCAASARAQSARGRDEDTEEGARSSVPSDLMRGELDTADIPQHIADRLVGDEHSSAASLFASCAPLEAEEKDGIQKSQVDSSEGESAAQEHESSEHAEAPWAQELQLFDDFVKMQEAGPSEEWAGLDMSERASPPTSNLSHRTTPPTPTSPAVKSPWILLAAHRRLSHILCTSPGRVCGTMRHSLITS